MKKADHERRPKTWSVNINGKHQLKSHESRVKSQESRVKSQESRVKSQESRVKSQESRVKSQSLDRFGGLIGSLD